ncbi:unnamed protein product [Paramecium sonneborni]|uniref:Uncharacterized protein n=1 Tax=Paramecium sonneborni TaxID=65129 RepID=A0A8S1PB27_9CILI|nr:unnamed protein product [Paramecium sonneborni]
MSLFKGCQLHNMEIKYICANAKCSGQNSQLCANCIILNCHQECFENNLIIASEKFNQVMKKVLKEKVKEDDGLLSLEETMKNFLKLYEEVKINAVNRRKKYLKIKQKFERFSYFNEPKDLQFIKQTTFFNEINFHMSLQDNKKEKPLLKYITQIDNSLKSIQDLFDEHLVQVQEQEQEQQQQKLQQQQYQQQQQNQQQSQSQKQPKVVIQKSDQIFRQNQIEDLQFKSQIKQNKETQKKSNIIDQQQQGIVKESNFSQVVLENQVEHPLNNQIIEQQSIKQQQEQSLSSFKINNNSQYQNNQPESDKSLIKQQEVNQSIIMLPQLPQSMSSINFQNVNSEFVTPLQNRHQSMINTYDNQMKNEKYKIEKSGLKYKSCVGSDFNKFANTPITKIVVIDKKNLIYLSEQKLVQTNLDQTYKKEITIQELILDFQRINNSQIIVHTNQSLLLLNKELDLLFKYVKVIEKNHLTFYNSFKINCYSTNAVIYLKDSNKLIGCQINQLSIIEQWEIKWNEYEEKLISMKVIQDNLHIGLNSGKIVVYDIKTLKQVKLYKIETNNYSTEIKEILFDEKFCLGIYENRIYRFNYGSNQTSLLCSTKERIITCAYCIDDEKNKTEIHILKDNQKINVFFKKHDQIFEQGKQQQGVLCLTCYLDYKQPNFYYGKGDGRIYCYYLWNK